LFESGGVKVFDDFLGDEDLGIERIL